jgi:outer membrane protein assembly factor BamB
MNTPFSEPPSDKSRLNYSIARRTMAAAGVFALVVATLMAYDFTRRTMKEPSQSALLDALKSDLKTQPGNESLRDAIRKLDSDTRQEFFRQRAFTVVGSLLLCASVILFLAAARWESKLRGVLPMPKELAVQRDWESTWTPAARWAVGGLFLIITSFAVGSIVWEKAKLPRRTAEYTGIVSKPVDSQAPALPDTHGEKTVSQRGDLAVATIQQLPKPVVPASAWPCFRGPGGLGISPYADVPDAWDAVTGKSIVWKTPIPLPGNNSPVICGDRVFVSGANAKVRQAYCFDAKSGKLLWTKDVPSAPESDKPVTLSSETGYAASTMATDGRYAAAIFANGDLAAFDLDGKLAWSKHLGIPANQYGHGASLTVYNDRLLVPFDQGAAAEKKSMIYCFDFATGNVVWQQRRAVGRSWSTPIVIRAAGRDQIITTTNPWVIAYDAANGNELWRAKCLQGDVAPSPVFAGGIVFAQANDQGPLAAIRPDGQGDVTKSHILWKADENMPDICSPLATDKQVYVVTSGGMVTAYDAKKGDKLWEEDLGDFQCRASPSMVGNRLYIIGSGGKGWVLEPGSNACKRVGPTDLGEPCNTSPAFQAGCFYVRGDKNLICVGKK